MRLAIGPLAAVLLALALPFAVGDAPSADPDPGAEEDARNGAVVIDAGHGGPDFGALGAAGAREKDLVLAVAARLGRTLEARGLRVVHTRATDEFVSLSGRTAIANRARGELFLSIHANSALSPSAAGAETYFLSVEASDAEAMDVAMTENQVFRQSAATPDSGDIVGAILGDLIRTEHLRASSAVAGAIQRRLERLAPGRGVKQAPFVVLMGVNMPAVLVELGFLTHPHEEARLSSPEHQQAIADAIADAVVQYRAALDRQQEVASE